MGSLYAKDVVDQALNEIGYEGEGSNHKYTIYSAELDKCNYWNMDAKNGKADWCSIFVNWCVYANTRNSDGEIEADKWDAHYFMFEPDKGENLAAGCGYAADYFQKNDAWTNNPERGDQVFFRNYAHTGIVVDWDDYGFYTVEGNIDGGKVGQRFYKYGDPDVDGFGRPRYDGWEYPEKVEAPVKDDNKPEPEPTPEPAPIPAEPPVSSNQGTVYTVCVGSWLNIRTEPTSESTKIGELYDGAKVIVYETEDGWARIGDNMWVFADFLE